MAIGEIRIQPGTGAQSYSSPQVSSEAFGAGIGRALQSIGGSLEGAARSVEDMHAALQARNEKQDGFEWDEKYIRWAGEQNRLTAERLRNAPADGRGLTNMVNSELEASREGFLAEIPEHLKGEFSTKTARYVEDGITTAFNFEIKQGDEFFRQKTNEVMNEQAAGILTGDYSGEQARSTVARLIDRSDLPELEKQALRQQTDAFLAQAEFQKELEYAREDLGPVREPTGSDVVAPGLQGYERGILNAISRYESSDSYNVRYGGTGGAKTFTDYSDHPRVFEERADGRVSSAAGRYQITATTWDYIQKHLHLPDFSPVSQDRAAIWLARQTYNKQVRAGEADFDTVLRSGDRQAIIGMKAMLTDAQGGWEAFREMKDDEFANIILGAQGSAGGGTGSSMAPDIWEDPRFAAVSFEDKVRLSGVASREADARIAESNREIEAALKARTDAILLSATQGQFQYTDEATLVEAGLLRDQTDVNNFRSAVRGYDEAFSALGRVNNALATGGLITSGDDKGLNQLIGKDGIEAVRGLDEDFGQGTVVPLSLRAGFIPSDVASELVGMLNSTQPAARNYASDILGTIYSANPHALENSKGITREVVQEAVMQSTLRDFMPEEQVQQRLADLRDPNRSGAIKQQRQDFGEQFEEEFTNDDLKKRFDTWAFGDEPSLPLDIGQEAVFRRDMKELYTQGMLASGDSKAAMQYATEMMRQRWAPSDIGGERRMMRDGPERFYPTVQQTHDWIDFSVREEFGLSGDTQFQLVSDAQTLAEGARFASAEDKTGLTNASFMIAVKTEDGVEIMLDTDGLPMRYAPEIGGEVRASIDRNIQWTALKQREQYLASEIAKDPTPDNVLLKEFNATQKAIREMEAGPGDPSRLIPERPLVDIEMELEALNAQIEEAEQARAKEGDFYIPQRWYKQRAELEQRIKDRKADGAR